MNAETEAKPKAKAKPKTAAKPRPKAKSGSQAMITVRQTGSPARRPAVQRATLIGLGLNKIGRTRALQDTPAVRGMIKKVAHLVEIVDGQA